MMIIRSSSQPIFAENFVSGVGIMGEMLIITVSEINVYTRKIFDVMLMAAHLDSIRRQVCIC